MTENKLDTFHDNVFSEEEIDNLIRKVSSSFVKKHFIDENITNQQYEKDVFKIIKNLIVEEIISIFGDSKKLQKELYIYIFKNYFKNIFKYISDNLLKEVANSNENVIDFLKYYSQDTIVADGIKYQVPKIKTDDGSRWNVVSIISVLKTYLKAKERLLSSQNKIEDLNKQLNYHFLNGLSPIEHNEKIEKQYNEIEEQIKKNALNIEIVRDSITIDKSKKNIVQNTQELNDFQDERLKLREKKTALIKNKIKQQEISKYEKLNLEIETIKKESQPDNVIIEQNQDKYLSIQNSLISALISKREAI